MTHPSATTTLLTVDEAREIAEQNPYIRYELHYGELVEMTEPKYKHKLLQHRFAKLLVERASKFGNAMVNMDSAAPRSMNQEVLTLRSCRQNATEKQLS